MKCPFGKYTEPTVVFPGEYPREHLFLIYKEISDGFEFDFVFGREPIRDNEPFHQIGPEEKGQICMRQTLQDVIRNANTRHKIEGSSGYLLGRKGNRGTIIVDGVVFVPDNSSGVRRSEPFNQALRQKLETLSEGDGELSIVGTFSLAVYANGVIKERDFMEKQTGNHHLYVLDRPSDILLHEIAIVMSVQGGFVVQNGVRIVEHQDPVTAALVTSIVKIEEPPITITLL